MLFLYQWCESAGEPSATTLKVGRVDSAALKLAGRLVWKKTLPKVASVDRYCAGMRNGWVVACTLELALGSRLPEAVSLGFSQQTVTPSPPVPSRYTASM